MVRLNALVLCCCNWLFQNLAGITVRREKSRRWRGRYIHWNLKVFFFSILQNCFNFLATGGESFNISFRDNLSILALPHHSLLLKICLLFNTFSFLKTIYHCYVIIVNISSRQYITVGFCDDLSLAFPPHRLHLEQFIFAPLISGTTYEIYIRSAERRKYVSGACDLKHQSFTNMCILWKTLLEGSFYS